MYEGERFTFAQVVCWKTYAHEFDALLCDVRFFVANLKLYLLRALMQAREIYLALGAELAASFGVKKGDRVSPHRDAHSHT